MQNQAFKLKKRFRHQEDFAQFYGQDSWTKSILNVEGGTVLGRTPFRWLLLVIFYAIFFFAIFVLWCLCYRVFNKTLKPDKPKWLLQQPGFSFEPCNKESSMNIDYYEHLDEEIDKYLDRISASLLKYGNVSYYDFGMCNEIYDFGYKQRSPCIFLKINYIIGFKTETFEHAKDLPPEAPNELRKYLEGLPEVERKSRIWVSCESKPSLDIEYYPTRYFETRDVYKTNTIRKLDVPVEYIRSYGYENAWYYNEYDFLRIIAIRLLHVPVNVRHNLRCYLWAKNIIRDTEGKMGCGTVRLQVIVKI